MIPQYAPMISTQGPVPFHRDGWVYEEKVDGWRILAYTDRANVRLVSRTGVRALQAVSGCRRGYRRSALSDPGERDALGGAMNTAPGPGPHPSPTRVEQAGVDTRKGRVAHAG
jgi:hypothetical protein